MGASPFRGNAPSATVCTDAPLSIFTLCLWMHVRVDRQRDIEKERKLDGKGEKNVSVNASVRARVRE